MFAGGAFSRASIFALGVMPYISASIFMQLAGIVIPSVAKMQREDSAAVQSINTHATSQFWLPLPGKRLCGLPAQSKWPGHRS